MFSETLQEYMNCLLKKIRPPNTALLLRVTYQTVCGNLKADFGEKSLVVTDVLHLTMEIQVTWLIIMLS